MHLFHGNLLEDRGVLASEWGAGLLDTRTKDGGSAATFAAIT